MANEEGVGTGVKVDEELLRGPVGADDFETAAWVEGVGGLTEGGAVVPAGKIFGPVAGEEQELDEALLGDVILVVVTGVKVPLVVGDGAGWEKVAVGAPEAWVAEFSACGVADEAARLPGLKRLKNVTHISPITGSRKRVSQRRAMATNIEALSRKLVPRE